MQVNVSTVDSYQGRQMDIIILSCVRSNPAAKGVGFVDDMRRMNVSITRAKRALWVLGSAATLRHSPVWAALLQVSSSPNYLSSPLQYPDCLLPSKDRVKRLDTRSSTTGIHSLEASVPV